MGSDYLVWIETLCSQREVIELPSSNHYFVFLKRVKVDASIGIHDFEQAAPQTLFVSVALLLEHPTRQDDVIENVVDYDFVRLMIFNTTKDRHWNLQETLCKKIADQCLDVNGVCGAIVSTSKPDVYEDTDEVGCRFAVFDETISKDFAWWAVNV